MIEAKEARRVCDRSGKLSFDKRYPGIVRYVEDKVKDAATFGDSKVILKLSKLLLAADPDMKMIDLAEFLRSNGYLVKVIDDSREDDSLLVISW
jgi:nitrate reductase beta subunit